MHRTRSFLSRPFARWGRRKFGAVVAIAAAWCMTTPALAQGIAGAGRFGLSTMPIAFESASVTGSTATDLRLSLGGPGLGMTLGLGAGANGLVGVNTMVTHQTSTVTVEDPFGGSVDAQASGTGVQFLPYLAYVAPSSGSVRGYVGATFGVSHVSQDTDSGTTVTTTSLLIGPIVGAHAFLDPKVSIDLGGQFAYVAGIGDASGVSGLSLGALLGVSAWWGDATEGTHQGAHSEDEPDGFYPAANYQGPPQAVSGDVAERSFDRIREVHVIRARFRAGSAQVLLVSAPQVELSTISVRLDVPSYDVKPENCAGLAVLVNDEPIAASDVTVEDDRTLQVAGRVDFQHFQTLGRAHSTLGFEACAKQWRLLDSQRPTLMKFLQLVSQVATDVQQGRLPAHAATAPSDPTPTEATQPAVAPASEPTTTPTP